MQRGGLADSMWFDFVFSLTFVYFYQSRACYSISQAPSPGDSHTFRPQ